jgi:hypothetical protein
MLGRTKREIRVKIKIDKITTGLMNANNYVVDKNRKKKFEISNDCHLFSFPRRKIESRNAIISNNITLDNSFVEYNHTVLDFQHHKRLTNHTFSEIHIFHNNQVA